MTYFQEAFREWVIQNNLTEKNASSIIGISPTLVNHLKNKKRNVTFKQADEIAERLNTTVFEMIMRGKKLLGDDKETENLTREQIQALEAFKTVLQNQRDSAAKLIVKTVLTYAQEKNSKK